MGGFRALLLAVSLLWVCFISACRTTEGQLYSPTSVPVVPYTALAPETESPPAAAGSKIPFLLLTAVILVGIIMIFASDQKPKKKKSSVSSRRRPVKKCKKA